MGTMAVRSIDRGFFAPEPKLRLVVMQYEDAEAHPVWINMELGLLFGLSRWYQNHLPPSGAVFRITPGEKADMCVLQYDSDTEDELAPGEERMEQLAGKRERVSRRPISIRDLMIELLEEHDDGLTFNALWAEMNAVRRTSRWQIASLLAYHACFSEDGGLWTADRALMTEPGDDDLEDFIIQPEEEEDEEAEEGDDEEVEDGEGDEDDED
jgi:hypothetical protein